MVSSKRFSLPFNFIQLFVSIATLLSFSNAKHENVRSAEERRFASFVDIGSTIYYQSLCLISDKTQIKMQCPSNDKIKILRTIYAYNPVYVKKSTANIDSCTFSVKDCNFDKEYTIDNECTGKNTCLTTIDKARLVNESSSVGQRCNDFNYVQINYQCLPHLPTKNICGYSKSELSHAYITTPNFPDKLEANSNCECTLTSNYENGQILLRRVDMKLPNDRDNQACGETYLEVNENNKGTERKCGYVREPGSIFGSGAGQLKLNFVTGNDDHLYDYGFWLEILASPPKENHLIEIVCNKGATPTATELGLESTEIIKKLKLIHDKIKRLNQTYMDTKIGSKLSNKTQQFIAKNNKKFLNMTSNIGIFSKKLNNQNNKNNNNKQNSLDNTDTTVSQNDLEREIEHFFSSQNLMSKQLDDLAKIDQKLTDPKFKQDSNKKIDFLSLTKNKKNFPIPPSQGKFKNNGKNKQSRPHFNKNDKSKKQQKLEQDETEEKEQEETVSGEEDYEEGKKSEKTESEIENENEQEQETEKSLVKELDSLSEELEIGEKLLSSSEGGQIALNKSTISETLAELIMDNTLNQQGQPSLMANEKSGTSVLNANAQRQNIGQPEGRSQSSSTDLRMPLIGYRRIISKNNHNHNHKNKNKYGYRKFRTPFQRQHTIYKRNTITYTDNNTLVNYENPNSLYTSTEVLTTKEQEQEQNTDLLTTVSDIIPDGLNTHEGPAQWLQPFQFEFDESNEFFLNDDYSNSTLFPYLDEEELKIRSTNHPKKSKNPNRKTVRVKINKTYKTNPTFTTLTTAATTTNPLELFSNSSFERLVSDDLNLNNSKISEENLNKTIINEMINLKNCEKNLTKLTVFYSNTDKLNCYETTQNQSYLKCIDDLLETKLLHKIGLFYYVQLQPLFISKSKMNCYDSNNTYLNWTLPTSKSMTTTQQKTTTSSISSSSLSSSEYDYDDETSSSAEQFTSLTTKKFEPTHFYLNENEFYINDLNFKETFSCSFITKKATNRKKLIWKLYLILKNQTCVQMEELSKSYIKLIEFRKKLESSKNLTQTQDTLNTTINKVEIVPKMNAITRIFTSTISTFTAATKPKNANQTFLSIVSNKIILIVLITSSICFILLANLILYIILRTRRKSSSQSNFSMSMNNRLLQNYLDLSVNSDNSKNDLDDSKKKTKLKNASNLLNSETATIVDDYVYSERHFNEIEYQYQTNQKNVIDSIELNNFDNSLQAKESQKPKLINQSQQSTENNYPLSTFNKFNSISGLITGIDSRTNMPQTEQACDNKLAQEIHYNNNNPLRANGFDDNYTNSTYEISRIPSLKKPIYSVSTIATQADMDRGTFLAERKDYKYRNQDMSDVESQILSIELDCYASLVDWKNSKLNNAQANEKSSKKELASVTVNDYVAFKNCLNFQLQAAKAMATSNQIAESSTENIPLAVTEFNSESQPFKNRMIVRISSLSSNRSSFQASNDKNKSTSPDCVTTSTTTNSCLNKPKEEKNEQLKQESKNLEVELPKMIFDAYQAALAASYSSNTKPEDFLKSFQNNLYMHLDTIPNFKSIQGSLMNSKEFVENFLKVNLQKSDQNDIKESHNLATQTQNPLKQSSTLNTILDDNQSSKSNKLDETCLNSSIKNKEIKDPNMIYSQVESSSSDNDNDNETESSSNSDSSDMSSSSDVNKNENQKKTVLSSSSSDSQKEMAGYNLEMSQASENISKQEKFKRMLDQEKLILEKAKKPVSLTDDSKFRSTIVYEDDDYSAEEYNYVNNVKDILNDDYSSSNEASSKNVRFADDVSYI